MSLPRPLRSSSLVLSLATLTALAAPGRALAAKIPLGEGPATLNVGVLAQPWMQLSQDGSPAGGLGTDFFLRRLRLSVSGNVTERFSFFVQVDQTNLGRDNNWVANFTFLDAFATVKVSDGPLWIDAGMMLTPFVHQSMQGAATLHTLDLHTSLIRFPANEGRSWRDAGVQVRGFAGPLHFRAGVFNGIEGTPATTTPTATPAINPHDIPRVAAHVRYNLLGQEDGFFFSGIYFTDQPKLSVGVGADYQPRALLSGGELQDDLNVGADIFLEYPLANDREVIFQTNAFRYFQGRDNVPSGFGFFSELGYRIGQIEPLVSVEYFNADVDNTDFVTVRPGLNLWLLKHTVSLKTEVAVGRQQVPTGPSLTRSVVGTAQLQVFY